MPIQQGGIMQNKELLIVGIDPGITTAYAILGLKGNILRLKSSKNLNLSSLTTEIVNVGKVIVVGSDVKYAPKLIEKFTSSLGARLIVPQDDMKIGFKERLTSEHKVNDAHQRDALAAAVFAYRELKPLIQKVNSSLKEKGLEHLSSDVHELTIKGMSISDAISMFEQLEQQPEIKKQKKRIREKIKKSQRIVDENLMLKQNNLFLQNEIDRLQKKVSWLEQHIETLSIQRSKDKLMVKDRKIQSQSREILSTKGNINHLVSKIGQLRSVISKIADHNYVITRKFKNLGEEVANSNLNNEVIVVDDANSFSEKAIGAIREKSIAVICKSTPSRALLEKSIKIIPISNVQVEEVDDIAVIEKESFEREIQKSKKDILFKIIDEYKQSRPELL